MKFVQTRQAIKSSMVIISGGGIGGLTLGIALKACNIPFLIIEQATSLSGTSKGGGIGLWGPALKALRQIGVEEELEAAGVELPCAGYREAGQIVSNDWLVRPGAKTRHTGCLCLKRSSLQAALLNKLQPSDLKLGSAVIGFREHARKENPNDVAVSVFLDNGETVEGSMLIGADGIHSTVRSHLFPNVTPRHCGYNYWQGIGEISLGGESTAEGVAVAKSDETGTSNGESYSLHDPTKQTTGSCEAGEQRKTKHVDAFEAWYPGTRFGLVPLGGGECFWFVCTDSEPPQTRRLEQPQTQISEPSSRCNSSSKESGSPLVTSDHVDWIASKLTPFGKDVCRLVATTPTRSIFRAELLEIAPSLRAFFFTNSKPIKRSGGRRKRCSCNSSSNRSNSSSGSGFYRTVQR